MPRLLLFLLLSWLGLVVPLSAAERAKVVAYVPNWIDLAAFARTIDYARITHLNVAFENPADDRGELSFHPQNAGLIATAHARGVMVLVSIGGGAASEDRRLRERYFGLLADKRRAGFVGKLAAYVAAHGFDGLDVDLEGPAINADYGAFVHELSLASNQVKQSWGTM